MVEARPGYLGGKPEPRQAHVATADMAQAMDVGRRVRCCQSRRRHPDVRIGDGTAPRASARPRVGPGGFEARPC
jgi:hypothetical protein